MENIFTHVSFLRCCMDEIPAGSECHTYYLCVLLDQKEQLLRDCKCAHTVYIKGSMELRDSQKACWDAEMAWLPKISPFLFSIQRMVLHQALHIPPTCLDLPGPAAVVLSHTGTSNLVIFFPRGQRVPQQMLILARILICNSPKRKYQVCI